MDKFSLLNLSLSGLELWLQSRKLKLTSFSQRIFLSAGEFGLKMDIFADYYLSFRGVILFNIIFVFYDQK